jgi:hypothetical protein
MCSGEKLVTSWGSGDTMGVSMAIGECGDRGDGVGIGDFGLDGFMAAKR